MAPNAPDLDAGVWRAAAAASHVPICLSDPHAHDEPLIWVNQAFEQVTGYSSSEAVGRNCRFLQGPDTDRRVVADIRRALSQGRPVTATLVNYRRDGQRFWNRLSLSPLHDARGRLLHYVGVQDDVTAEIDALQAREVAVDELRSAHAALLEASDREHRAAMSLQNGLLPVLSSIDGLDVAARYVPSTAGAAIGGDWFDVVELPDGRITVTVGDVMGHDMRAAAAMGQVRSMMRALSWTGEGPASVLSRLDALARSTLDVPFASVFHGVLTLSSSSGATVLTWSRAGHPPALLRQPDGRVDRLDGSVVPPLGLIRGRPVAEQTTIVPDGSVLVVFTDGLVESREEDIESGLSALARVLHEAGAATGSAERLLDRIVGALVPTAPGDDTCVLVVRPVGPVRSG